MNPTHPAAIQAFAFKVKLLLTLRVVVRMATLWFLVWGVIVLAWRISQVQATAWLALGIFGFVPIALLAVGRERRRLPSLTKLRANYDRINACGGIVMAEEAADMSAWLVDLPPAAVPKLRWRSTRALLLLGLAAGFAATALLLPERVTRLGKNHSLEIGPIIEQLQAEVKTLAQEKIVDDKKAGELQQQLSQLQKDASAYDPNKTWEALDHVKQANTDAAKQAAAEAITKTETLAQAETLAKAMQAAAEAGMSEATAAQAAQDLAALLNSAKLEAGILNGQIPPELLAGLNGLNKEQMEKLAKALELNKNSLGLTVSNLASLKLIDPAMLVKCQSAGQCNNPGALADYLSQCKGGKCDDEFLFSWLAHPGRGGPGGGGPEAPMLWDNDTSEKDLKFQPHALPPAAKLADAQLVGVSKSAPELGANAVVAGHGALDNAAASGGSAQTQIILPEHRQAVQNFFKRDN